MKVRELGTIAILLALAVAAVSGQQGAKLINEDKTRLEGNSERIQAYLEEKSEPLAVWGEES